MDNLGAGGNRGDMGKNILGIFGGNGAEGGQNGERGRGLEKETKNKLGVEKEIEKALGVEKAPEKASLSGEAKTELGSRAAEMFGTPEVPLTAKSEVAPEVISELMPPEVASMEPISPDTEYRPLAEDGSTEGEIDKDKILTFGGDLIDKESEKQVMKVISELKNDPFELDNKRNEMMANGLRDNYGRIFGNNNEIEEVA